MTTTDISTDNPLIQLVDTSDAINRAQALLEAASLILEGVDRPDLMHTIGAVQAVLCTADDTLDIAREKVDALRARYKSPTEGAGRRELPASLKH